MSPLTSADRRALQAVLAIPCDTAGCPCMGWRRAIADALRLTCPTLDDATIAHVVLQVSAQIAQYAVIHGIAAMSLGGLLSGAAAELAALELQNPTEGTK